MGLKLAGRLISKSVSAFAKEESKAVVPKSTNNSASYYQGGEYATDEIRITEQHLNSAFIEPSAESVLGNSYKAIAEKTVPIKLDGLPNALNAASKGAWVKVYEAGIQNGQKVEIHYFRNNTTKQVFDVKLKYLEWRQKEF